MTSLPKIAVIAVTDSSEETGRFIQKEYRGEADLFRSPKGGLKELTARLWPDYEGLVFIMASGIVLRMIAPLIDNKYEDPAVVTVDDACRFAISTLSGHEGGANFLTWRIAAILGSQPVITTASDTNRRITMGIGCRKGIESKAVEEVVRNVLEEMSLTPEQIRCAVSLDAKKTEEGLIHALDKLEIPLVFLSPSQINRIKLEGIAPSEAAMRHFGIPGVAEPCALITAGPESRLIMKRKKDRGVTIALAEEPLCQKKTTEV